MVAENIAKILASIPENVTLVAVSKTKPVEMIMEAYSSGYKIFGENKALELRDKYEQLPKDIEWHFIGHLQTNKVKYILPFVHLIHSVDSLKLLKEIDRRAGRLAKKQKCLLEFHIAGESTKHGFHYEEVEKLLDEDIFSTLSNISICGVMGMATYTEDRQQIRREFRHLKGIFDRLKTGYFSHNEDFKEISMGMSGDYQIAIEEGSTIIRIGSTIFGARNT